MNITSISLSYALLGATLIACSFFIYFKTLVIKTGSGKDSKEKIIGTMKQPEVWRNRNNKMSYLSLFWTVVSLSLFVYLKFFHTSGLISILYIFAYIALIVISTALGRVKDRASN